MARQKIETVNVGIDTGKAQLDVFIHETQQFVSFANEPQDIHRLVLLLELFPVERIVIEATGRLERPFVEAALERGLSVIVMQPIKIRRYAGAIGLLNLETYELELIEIKAEPHRVRLAPDGRTAVVISDRKKLAWVGIVLSTLGLAWSRVENPGPSSREPRAPTGRPGRRCSGSRP